MSVECHHAIMELTGHPTNTFSFPSSLKRVYPEISQIMSIKVELGGGMEILFSNQKTLIIPYSNLCTSTNDSTRTGMPTIKDLISLLKTDHLKTPKPELFSVDESVRAGILVLINDVDWELEGGVEAVVKEGDTITFISTLHGG